MEEDKKQHSRIKAVVEESLDVNPVPVKAVDTEKTEQPPKIEQPQPPTLMPLTNEANDSDLSLETKEKGTSFKVIFITVLITAIVVGLVAGGVYVYLSGTGKLVGDNIALMSPTPGSSNAVLATASPSPVASLEPSLEPEIALDKYKVNILNGSGKIGEAGNAKKLLEEAGFKVGSTGNAKTFDFKKTLVAAKKSISSKTVDLVVGALGKSYKVELSEALKESDSYDITITVGSE